jgi:hypothetical protein
MGLAGIYFYRKPDVIAWFGHRLSKDHEANLIVSYIFSMVFALSAFLFSLGPIFRLLDL